MIRYLLSVINPGGGVDFLGAAKFFALFVQSSKSRNIDCDIGLNRQSVEASELIQWHP
jgi:hypothetical protein